MTKTIDITTLNNSIQAVIALTEGGDEIVLEKNGAPVVKITPYSGSPTNPHSKRILGLGTGKGYFMSEDFDDELPDEFWGFEKEL